MIKKGISVEIICGKDKGKKGEIIEILRSENKAKVKGINFIKKHETVSYTHLTLPTNREV